jgi:hypothetical protein
MHLKPIFKKKKGPATISLGLNYCSMDSSQSTSRDTVPFNQTSPNRALAENRFSNIYILCKNLKGYYHEILVSFFFKWIKFYIGLGQIYLSF